MSEILIDEKLLAACTGKVVVITGNIKPIPFKYYLTHIFQVPRTESERQLSPDSSTAERMYSSVIGMKRAAGLLKNTCRNL
jgi:hypothetical protein